MQYANALYEPVQELFETGKPDTERMHTVNTINSVRFENADIGYTDKTIFSNLSLEFKSGKVYIIEGRSGFGKSTLISALLAKNPVKSGSVFYNDSNLNTISLDCIAERTALISQNMYLMNTTIKNNITLFDPSIPDEAVERICTKLGLPSPETETGASEIDKVSGGERKKIAFARLFLQQSKKNIIIFDEIYANLDKNSMSVMTALLKELVSNKIIIVVSHDVEVKAALQHKNIPFEVINAEYLADGK